MGIRRLGEERLLPRGERDIGWRKHTRPRPRHLRDAILVEQRPALVVGSPWCCSVHHRLGEQDDRPRRYLRNDHAGGLFRRLVDLARQLEVALVTPGNTPESAIGRSGIGKPPGRYHESFFDFGSGTPSGWIVSTGSACTTCRTRRPCRRIQERLTHAASHRAA